MKGDSYPELQQFLGAYFHQDFMLDYGSPDAAIDAILTEEPPDRISVVCDALERVLPLIERIKDPETFLWQHLWCYYLPKADGFTVADWLKHLHKKLCAGLPQS